MKAQQAIEMVKEWLKTPLMPNETDNPLIAAANDGIWAAQKEIRFILEIYELNKDKED